MVSDGFLAAPTEVIDGAVQWDDLGLVDSKFQAPWTRPGIIGRPALVERLTATDAPVVAVVGPAGYGKTTLLGQWAATSDVPVFWLTLDAHDNDPAILLEYLVAIMNRIEPADPQLCQLAVGRGRRRHELGPASPGDARVVAATSIRSRRGPHRIGDRPTLRRLARHGRTQPAARVSNRLRVTR